MEITSGKITKAVKTVVYGTEGVGKSTFAAQFPRPLFIDTEQRTVHMDVRRLPAPQSWTELLNEVQWAAEHTGELNTLVLDTADWAEILCSNAVCARYGKTGVEDFGYGKGWTYLKEEFGKLLNALSQLVEQGINVTVTAHAAMRKFEQPEESGAYDRWEMKLSRQVAPLLKEWADLLLFAQFETVVVRSAEGKVKATQGTRRVMYTTHHACWDAKNRFGLKDKLDFEYGQIAHLFPGEVNPGRKAPEESEMDERGEGAPRVDKPVSQAEPEADEYMGVPEALARLMREDKILPNEVIYAVAQKGYYPVNTPIANYDPAFIQGVLIGAWAQVKAMVMANREDTPF